MKRLLYQLVLTLFSSVLLAQVDVTDDYITNSGFDLDCNYTSTSLVANFATTNDTNVNSKEISGWTRPVIGEWLAAASFEYGCTTKLNGVSVPSVAPDGKSSGARQGALGLSVGWGVKLVYTQDVTLPSGHYQLKYDVYNSYASSQSGSSRVAWVPDTGSEVLSKLSSFPSSVWTRDSITFSLSEETSGKIQVGLLPSGSSSSGLPRVFFDGVRLIRTPLDAVATLSSLSPNVGKLSPAFDPEVYEYTLTVDAGVSSIDISATASSARAQIEGDGIVNLDQGKAEQTLKVIAADGESVAYYTVTIVSDYITSWDGDGAVGAGSEPNHFGWSCTPAITGWTEANVFGIRFQDGVTYSYYGTSQTGRILYVRWDGTGGANTASIYNYALPQLEACKTYILKAKIAWHSNGSAPTYKVEVNTAKDNSGVSLGKEEVLVSSTGDLVDVNLVFTTHEAGSFYFNLGSTSAVLAAVGDLQLVEYTGDPFVQTSISEMTFDSTSLSQTFNVSAYGLTQDISFDAPQGMTLSPATISASDAQCGVELTASFSDASYLSDGQLLLHSGDVSSDITIKEILPPYIAPGTYELSNDGTWCWFQDPRAVYYEGEKKQTYTGWITSKGKVQVASLNHETGEVIINTISPDDFMQVDDHNNPTFLVREDGRILVSYSGHFYGPMRVIVSTNPEDITSFGPEANFGSNVTYANPYQIGNTTTMFYRDGNTWHPTINTSDDGGLTWDTPRELITRNGNQQRPYAKYTQDKSGGIHIVFTTGHPRQEQNNHVYYIYFKNNKFYKADGTYVKNLLTDGPLNIDSGEAETIYDASQGKGWTWDITLDEDENPVLLYAAFPDDLNHHYYYAYWDGKQWVSKHIVNSGRWFPQTPEGGTEPEPNYSGGMALDPNNPSIVYLSKQVNGVFEIFKYTTTDKGSTWEIEAITKNTPKGIINVRPVVPRGHKSGSCDVIWMRGSYITYANYLTSVMYYSPNSLSADLDSIVINGEVLADFRADLMDYQIELEDASVENLIIEGFASDISSNVEVVLPIALPGKATLTVKSDGAVKTKVYTINITVSTALNTLDTEKNWFSPNPVNDVLYFDKNAFVGFQSLTILNLQGQEMKMIADCESVNLSDLKEGLYLLQLKHSNGLELARIVKASF